MYEKVNPDHPDKIADRIAGAIVDLAYKQQENPKIAVEVLVGHRVCHVIAETSTHISVEDVIDIAARIAGSVVVDYVEVPQDVHLAKNQRGKIRCGDNGIFKGVPITKLRSRSGERNTRAFMWKTTTKALSFVKCGRPFRNGWKKREPSVTTVFSEGIILISFLAESSAGNAVSQ